MTFCSKEQKESEIITKVEHSNNYYAIKYLDGSESSFYNSDKDFLKNLEEQMINQAKKREKTDYTSINIKNGDLL